MGRKAGLLIDTAALINLRDKEGWSQAKLADLAGVDPKVVWKAENDKGIDPETARKICEVTKEYGLEYDDLVLVGGAFKIPGNAAELTAAEKSRIVDELARLSELHGKVVVEKTENGCIKFTIKLSLRDAKKLEAAFRDGKLKPLNVLSVEIPVRQVWLGVHTASIACSAAGILCGAVSFLPVWRVPYFAAGIILSLVGGAIGRKRLYTIVLAGWHWRRTWDSGWRSAVMGKKWLLSGMWGCWTLTTRSRRFSKRGWMGNRLEPTHDCSKTK